MASARDPAHLPLAAIGKRLPFDSFRISVRNGRGKMPAFRDLDDNEVEQLFEYLDRLEAPAGAGEKAPAKKAAARGPVVASGGAPGGLIVRRGNAGQYTPLGGPDYPAGSQTPRVRYYTDWGLYPNQPYIIGPPWSQVVAYDLNAGTIKWKVPLGQDAVAAAQGAKDTGAFMAEHHGMIVTSTGLIFIAASDGKIRALDEETGKVLWTATLPAGAEGIPAMYEAGGRQYLVVSASSNVNSGGGHPGKQRHSAGCALDLAERLRCVRIAREMNASAGASILHFPVNLVVASSETNLDVTPDPCGGVQLLTRRLLSASSILPMNGMSGRSLGFVFLPREYSLSSVSCARGSDGPVE